MSILAVMGLIILQIIPSLSDIPEVPNDVRPITAWIISILTSAVAIVSTTLYFNMKSNLEKQLSLKDDTISANKESHASSCQSIKDSKDEIINNLREQVDTERKEKDVFKRDRDELSKKVIEDYAPALDRSTQALMRAYGFEE